MASLVDLSAEFSLEPPRKLNAAAASEHGVKVQGKDAGPAMVRKLPQAPDEALKARLGSRLRLTVGWS